MPYIDLHLHLDGAITPEVARALAPLAGVALPDDAPGQLERALSVAPGCTSLNDFLDRFELPISLLQRPEAVAEAVRLVQESLREQGVAYCEIRFAPQQFTRAGTPQAEVVAAALAGLAASPLACNLILCCMRGADNAAANEETLELACRNLVEDGGVVAMDLAGAEALFPTADYAPLFARARAAGVPLTIHAGEAAGPESVRQALTMGARRIGHGIRAAADEALLDLLAERGTVLEVCPTSNRHTHAVEDMGRYPLRRLLGRGVRVTLATDDPAISRTTIAREEAYARELAGLADEELLAMRLTAVEAAFTTDETRAALREALLRGEERHADR